jgi:hypothetical protein
MDKKALLVNTHIRSSRVPILLPASGADAHPPPGAKAKIRGSAGQELSRLGNLQVT